MARRETPIEAVFTMVGGDHFGPDQSAVLRGIVEVEAVTGRFCGVNPAQLLDEKRTLRVSPGKHPVHADGALVISLLCVADIQQVNWESKPAPKTGWAHRSWSCRGPMSPVVFGRVRVNLQHEGGPPNSSRWLE